MTNRRKIDSCIHILNYLIQHSKLLYVHIVLASQRIMAYLIYNSSWHTRPAWQFQRHDFMCWLVTPQINSQMALGFFWLRMWEIQKSAILCYMYHYTCEYLLGRIVCGSNYLFISLMAIVDLCVSVMQQCITISLSYQLTCWTSYRQSVV